MSIKGAVDNAPGSTLLAADEPAPFAVLNPESVAPILLVCDHASDRFPAALGSMGLDPFARRCHLAVDIGAGALTRAMAAELQATAILCQYSRLVVDCNRELMDAGAFLEFGDGVVIPGNRNLTQADKELRAREIHAPYHRGVANEILRLQGQGIEPLFVAVHSFTPVLNGVPRQWEIGVLWDRDADTSGMFIQDFEAAGFIVGDNEPYSGRGPQDFTIDNHAESAGLPHVGIEIRQDLIHQQDGVERIAAVMHKIVSRAAKHHSAKKSALKQPPKIA